MTLAKLLRGVRNIRDVTIGKPRARARLKDIESVDPSIVTGVNRFREKLLENDQPSEESPIFIFSAGWRSGSTLLQRLVMSEGNVFIWGEPYDHCQIVQSMAKTMMAFSAQWPAPKQLYNGDSVDLLSRQWVATMYPSYSSLIEGHRAAFDATFRKPALASGADRWGIKEVRLDIDHAHYLKMLYPSAKFLFLYRNPYESYRSYKSFGSRWFFSWPDEPVFTPRKFGRIWRNLTSQFVEHGEILGGFVLSYEDLLSDESLRGRLEEYLHLELDWNLLDMKIDGHGKSAKEQKDLTFLEKVILGREVGPLVRQLY